MTGREQEPSHVLVFRNDRGQECQRTKATQARVKGMAWSEDIWWRWPEDEKVVETIRRLCRGAYSAGEQSARQIMREALGLRESGEDSFLVGD